mmetsp:Transcript_10754/g.14455  ORF Transcript_10754/g.14455 Transcript_10754/m.14455 type:complete len:121 (-) Transcript_10754:256-618(-)|eukprot:CAMPEP_0170467634 /NCGR_PEP_ID=MMETSP0123-20130129/11145_1 /TAXON_ID=182087 /ORGANISM="Favella ehrenbergii, Strain Fehren 1" /LENGTH=120 /DNA_ID=CAMNT_0010734061 /DNA_START=187 /DNA_END=549 /DNA_ORIENTATION=-
MKQYCIIHDCSGSKSSGAASYFHYKGRLFELHRELIQVRSMKQKTFEEVAEELRKQVVSAMRNGNTLCIDVGKLKVSFAQELNSLPWADIFNFQQFREQDEHTKIVRPDEMYMAGMQNQG